MSEHKYNEAYKRGFEAGAESHRASCLYGCSADFDEYQKGKNDEIIRILDYVRKNCKDKELEHFLLSEQIEVIE